MEPAYSCIKKRDWVVTVCGSWEVSPESSLHKFWDNLRWSCWEVRLLPRVLDAVRSPAVKVSWDSFFEGEQLRPRDHGAV